MQEVDRKSQRIAIGLVVAAVVIALGYYILLSSGISIAKAPTSAQVQPATQQTASSAGAMSTGGMGLLDCPRGQVGALLGAEVLGGEGKLSGGGSGAQIGTVRARGLAGEAGLEADDIVASCNGAPTTCPKGLLQALSDADKKKPIVLGIERQGKAMTVTLWSDKSAAAKSPASQTPQGK